MALNGTDFVVACLTTPRPAALLALSDVGCGDGSTSGILMGLAGAPGRGPSRAVVP